MTNQGTELNPFTLDEEDEDEGRIVVDLVDFGDEDVPDPADIITIDDFDGADASRPDTPTDLSLAVHDIDLDIIITESCKLENGDVIRPKDTVELEDTEERAENELHSGDFLRVKTIVVNPHTDRYSLKGYRLRRMKYLGGTFDWKLNEVVMTIRVPENDDRCPFVAGLEEVDLDQVVCKRDCLLTNAPFPLHSFREGRGVPEGINSMMSKNRQKQAIYHRGGLVCRWLNIQDVRRTGKFYGGMIRAIYGHESDTAQGNSIVEPREPSTGESSESSTPSHSRKRHIRTASLEELPSDPKRTRTPLPTKAVKYTFGDCFCGAGGSSTGAKDAGLRVKWGLDKDEPAMEAYCYNHEGAIPYLMDAHDFPPAGVSKAELKVDIMHLSPPCCFWSPAHTVAGSNDQANFEAIYTVGPILQKFKPRIATLEQTFGLLTSTQHSRNFHLMNNDILKAGYDLRYKNQDLSEFGLPQKRRRLLIIATKRGTPLPPFPKPTHGPRGSGRKPFVSVAEALRPLNYLDTRSNDDKYHLPHEMKRIDKPPYDARDKMVPGCITTSGGENHHPSGKRRFTPREIALLQSFPVDYIFTGSRKEAKKQIGNAFPSIMAKALYKSCAKTLEAYDNGLITLQDDLSDLDVVLKQKLDVREREREREQESSVRPKTKYRYLRDLLPNAAATAVNNNPFVGFGSNSQNDIFGNSNGDEKGNAATVPRPRIPFAHSGCGDGSGDGDVGSADQRARPNSNAGDPIVIIDDDVDDREIIVID